MSERTGLKFPEIKLDPSKIKDRWGLAGVGLIVWLVIAFRCLSNQDANIWNNMGILLLTTITILSTLAITVNPVSVKTSSEKEAPERARFYARVTTKDIQIVGSAKDIREMLGDSIMDRGNEK